MSESIYILTVLYFFFVADDYAGEQFISFMKKSFNLDLQHLHNSYRSLRDSILSSFNLKLTAA